MGLLVPHKEIFLPSGVLPAILADQGQDEIAVLQRRENGNGGKFAAIVLAVRIGHIRFVVGGIAFEPCTFEGAHRKEQIVGGCILEHLEKEYGLEKQFSKSKALF